MYCIKKWYAWSGSLCLKNNMPVLLQGMPKSKTDSIEIVLSVM